MDGILARGVARTLGAIEARVERLEAPEAEPVPEAAAETPSSESYHRRHAETIRQHLEEPVDPDWGPRTKALVEEAFETLAELAPINVRDIDCRSESCRAVIRWESLASATETYQRLVVSPIRLGCGRTILLPDGPATGPVEVTMTFDCAEWKAKGSEPVPAELLPKLVPLTAQR
jgi:hypothetical protein